MTLTKDEQELQKWVDKLVNDVKTGGSLLAIAAGLQHNLDPDFAKVIDRAALTLCAVGGALEEVTRELLAVIDELRGDSGS